MAHGLARKYGSELPSRTAATEDGQLAGRDNKYSVSKAEKPKQSNSAGVDQDGTDYSYFIEAQLGSGQSPLYMLIDTGASTTWVMGSDCTSKACNMHSTFKADSSKTLKDQAKPFAVEYGSGSVSGSLVTDTVKIAGLSVAMDFGLTNVTSDEFTQFPFEGILGLSIGNGGPQNFLVALKNAKLVDSNVFAVSLSRSADGLNDGEITFGGPNPDKFTGDISYTPVDPKHHGSWAIIMDDAEVNGKPVGLKDKLAYIDTGTTYAFAPAADVKKLYEGIPGAEADDQGVTWTLPCDTKASIALTFGGKTFPISAKDFLSGPDKDKKCTGSIYGLEVVKGAWLLGDLFLKNVYSVFDMDQARIGFASKKAAKRTSSGSGSSTTVATSTLDTGAVIVTTMTSPESSRTGSPMGLGGQQSGEPTATAAADTTESPSSGSSGGQLRAGGSWLAVVWVFPMLALMM